MDKAAASASASARFRTTVLMNLASVVEKADEQVLPAVYYFVGRSLNATPAQLGTLTLCRALVQVQPISLLYPMFSEWQGTQTQSLHCVASAWHVNILHVATQAATSPISGVLGDKYNRTHIVAVGCFLWGVMTALIGLSTSLHQASSLLAQHHSAFWLCIHWPCNLHWCHRGWPCNRQHGQGLYAPTCN